jgi:hypothetical protein
LLSSPLATGCTIIGAIGTAASSKKAEQVEVGNLDARNEGRGVTFTLHDSTSIEGRFRGIRFESTDAYLSRYAEWKAGQEDARLFPDFQSTVTINPDSGESVTGTFIGFDFRQIYVRSRSHPPAWDLVRVRSVTDSTASGLTTIPGAILFDETTRGTLPLRSTYMVDTGEGDADRSLDARQISSIELHGQTKFGPLLMGMAADGLVLFLASQMCKDSYLCE